MILVLRQGKYKMSLEYVTLVESKELTKKQNMSKEQRRQLKELLIAKTRTI